MVVDWHTLVRRHSNAAEKAPVQRGVAYSSLCQPGAARATPPPATIERTHTMKISARNQFAGTIASVEKGAVNAVVAIEVAPGKIIKADITCEAVEDLGLEAGKPAIAVVKATNVMFAEAGQHLQISARNQFCGDVTKIQKGAVNGHVTITTEYGLTVSGSITNAAIEELGLEVGKPAVAFVKSTDVLVAVEA